MTRGFIRSTVVLYFSQIFFGDEIWHVGFLDSLGELCTCLTDESFSDSVYTGFD